MIGLFRLAAVRAIVTSNLSQTSSSRSPDRLEQARIWISKIVSCRMDARCTANSVLSPFRALNVKLIRVTGPAAHHIWKVPSG
ncbi:hypothetical protein BDZ45DRAFT_26032 [Acephala macrosclerotiorum]|nr:hypothetical protein BDZ45DRAFT_26032 [Acephala macrosclerotiorum]